MVKFYVQGDETNQPGFSTSKIVNSLNIGAEEAGVFDPNGVCLQYDSCCQPRTNTVKAFISTYEIDYPANILNFANGKPIIGVSQDNLKFIINGGYPEDKTGYFHLGVDSNLWSGGGKAVGLDEFIFGIYSESLIRGGMEFCIEAFGKLFSGNKSVVLKIKDRNATPQFEKYVNEMAKYYNIKIDYRNGNWSISRVLNWLAYVDCHLYVNYSSTFALPPIELASCAKPTIIMPYSGPRDYFDDQNALLVDYNIEYVDERLEGLINIGCRNFFFLSGYKNRPTWAVPKLDSLVEKLDIMHKSTVEYRKDLGNKARLMAKSMTWKKSALSLSFLLEKWF